MTGINDDREVSQFLEKGNTGEVEDITRLRVIATDTTLAEDDVGVACRDDVFGS